MGLAQSSPSNTLLIGPGDDLHVSVQDMPEMEQYPRVTDAGDVPIIGVGNVRVIDMTPGEAAAAIQDRLVSSRYLNHPQVSVVVDQYATKNVTLLGEVRTPGAYQLSTPRPILDVIALGGGLNEVADRRIIVERHGDQNHPIHYNLSNDAEQAIKEQVFVNPGDTIFVPKVGIIYVLGDVTRPGGYTMNNNESKISLLEALATAGGAANTANINHARLIRKADHSEVEIALGDIQKGRKPDFPLEPGDILYVPFSFGKHIVLTGAAGITGAATAAAIYTAH
jgi:polysaccharide export outer membrane protein